MLTDANSYLIDRGSILSPTSRYCWLTVNGERFNAEQLFRLIRYRQLGRFNDLHQVGSEHYLQNPAHLHRDYPVGMEERCLVPQIWVQQRNQIRHSIFVQCYNQRTAFREALDQVPEGTTFLFSGRLYPNDLLWTTGERENTLLQHPSRYTGKNLLGNDLATARLMIRNGEPATLDLGEWLNVDHALLSQPRYSFLVIGDSTLKHLAWVESGLVLVRGGSRLRHAPELLGMVNHNHFQHVVIQLGVLDLSLSREQAQRQFRKVQKQLQGRASSVWWSGPLPNERFPLHDLLKFKRRLRRWCSRAKFNYMDVDALVGDCPFRSLSDERRVHPRLYYDDKLHINSEGMRRLLLVWESFLPLLGLCDRGISARPYQQSIRPANPETHHALNHY